MKERGHMSLFSSLLTPPIRRFMVVACGGFAVLPWGLVAQVATAPTASEDPAVIDQAWQKASANYDAQRAAIVEEVDRVGHQGSFRPDWESLEKYEVPEWYKDAKFGIFIHWGVYSVPAFGNEWYPRNMYREGSEEYKHHIATYGPQDQFGYKDFIPLAARLGLTSTIRSMPPSAGPPTAGWKT
jgi:alpha-L-fucosidase